MYKYHFIIVAIIFAFSNALNLYSQLLLEMKYYYISNEQNIFHTGNISSISVNKHNNILALVDTTNTDGVCKVIKIVPVSGERYLDDDAIEFSLFIGNENEIIKNKSKLAISTDDFFRVLLVQKNQTNNTNNLRIIDIDFQGVIFRDKLFTNLELGENTQFVAINDSTFICVSARNVPNQLKYLEIFMFDSNGNILKSSKIQSSLIDLELGKIAVKDNGNIGIIALSNEIDCFYDAY